MALEPPRGSSVAPNDMLCGHGHGPVKGISLPRSHAPGGYGDTYSVEDSKELEVQIHEKEFCIILNHMSIVVLILGGGDG